MTIRPQNQISLSNGSACLFETQRGPKLEEGMKSLAKKVQRFLVSEDGPTAVEYAVMLALIVIVCLAAIQAIGSNACSVNASRTRRCF